MTRIVLDSSLDCHQFGCLHSLLWYKDMFDNGRQAVQYQALVQFVKVPQKGNRECALQK